jgi:hypothetical protein
MKKLAILSAALLITASAFGQGTVTFNNRVTGVVDFKIGLEDLGGQFLGYLDGVNFTAEIWGGLTPDSLAPATPPTTFRSGNAVGYVNPVTVTLPGVPLDAPSAYIQVRVWENQGGAIAAWEQAIANDPIARGLSQIVQISAIGGNFNTPPNLVNELGAFNIAPIPEPSMIALGLVGAVGLLLRFRRK